MKGCDKRLRQCRLLTVRYYDFACENHIRVKKKTTNEKWRVVEDATSRYYLVDDYSNSPFPGRARHDTTLEFFFLSFSFSIRRKLREITSGECEKHSEPMD